MRDLITFGTILVFSLFIVVGSAAYIGKHTADMKKGIRCAVHSPSCSAP